MSAEARFEELAPWYVNGTLSAEDRAWVESYLQQHPEAESELAWYRSLATRIQDNAPKVPETIGLGKVLTLIHGDRPTLAERISAFFGSFGLRPATAFAGLAIFAVQAGFILHLLDAHQEDESEIRALKASVVEEGPMLRINFAPDAKESDIRHLLMSVQGRLAGGPGQLGDYFVVVPKGKEKDVAATLEKSPIVQAVAEAPGLPPRGE